MFSVQCSVFSVQCSVFSVQGRRLTTKKGSPKWRALDVFQVVESSRFEVGHFNAYRDEVFRLRGIPSILQRLV